MALLTSSRRAARIAAVFFVAGCGALAAPPARMLARAEAPPPPIEAVYAAFTLNLTRFITWPAGALGEPDAPLVIGTFAREPLNRELEAAIRGEKVAGHPMQLIRLRSLNDAARCHVVFVSEGVINPASVLARIERRPVLTISDADGFLALGGHVRLVPDAPHARLQISAVNLRASGLEARAQLLRIAPAP